MGKKDKRSLLKYLITKMLLLFLFFILSNRKKNVLLHSEKIIYIYNRNSVKHGKRHFLPSYTKSG